PKACIKILMQSVPYLRHELSRSMRMRVMPELRFLHDESIERGMRIQALLHGLEVKDGDDAHEPGEDS
ncbi:MAG: rbfA, partial [Proteobacteria bacterium]|nr:rbfA [Pseudomonadota bacterium]